MPDSPDNTPGDASTGTPAKSPPPLPNHVEEALQAMAAMHNAHHEQASGTERLIDRVTAAIAAPRFVLYAGIAIALAMLGNYLVSRAVPTFSDALSCIALLIAVLILASQRRADKLANLREQMTLEMTLLTTQKVSKVIDLMEELRRDSPDIKDRVDLEAIEMSGMPDHGTVLQAIQEITDTVAGTDTALATEV